MARDPAPRTVLPFTLSLVVRQHADGTATARVLGASDLAAWGPDLDGVIEDLMLAAQDRIERSHPSALARWQAPRGRALVEVDVPDVVELLAEEPELRPSRLGVVVERDGAWTRAWLPALDARLWIDEQDELEPAVRELVARLLKDLDGPRRLGLRAEGGTRLETMDLQAELAPLVRFTGDHLGHGLLPVADPEPEERDEHGRLPVPTPTLDRIGTALHDRRDTLVRARGRTDEVAELLRMLERPGAAVIVVGPPACGKSAVLDQVARDLPGRAWFADASRLVDADPFTGWRQQTVDVAREIEASDGVWFVGDPIDLLDAGKHIGSEMNVAQVLKPLLTAGRMRVIGECSEATWGRLEARDAGFARLFTPWRLTEPPAGRLEPILAEIAGDLSIPVTPEGLSAAVGLCRRYGPADALLGTTAWFLRRLVDEAKARGQRDPLGRDAVIARFCAETGLPPILVRDEELLDPAALEGWFRERLVGQDDAVSHLVDLLAVIKGGMSDLSRPLGSFLFVGPTGVGKTEASKALATWLFGDPSRLVRFDMSEFAGPDCLIRLLDAESGLVARVRRTPFCVVLLDEIEKAHPAVFDLLLQALGEARLSDPDGRAADLRNAVVLMTSNLGVGSFRRPTGFGADAASSLRDHVFGEVQRFFRPELFNRIDRVVAFGSLGAAAIGGIAGREVAAVARREGLRGRGIELDVEPAVVGWLAARGVDVQLGARPLKRAVTTHLVAPLARHLAGSGPPPRVRVQVEGDGLGFHNAPAGERAVSMDGLGRVMERLRILRHRGLVWSRCQTARSGVHEIALVDRLMAGKRFWADANAARARSDALEPLRAALDAHTRAREQVAACEELALEAWLARDPSLVESLTEQADEITRQLRDAELSLAGTPWPRPDRADLEITPDEGSGDFGRRLTVAYLRIAERCGWSVKLRQPGTSRLEPWPELEKAVDRVRTSRLEGPWLLQLQGAHAAPLLAGELGMHTVKDVTTSRVSVGFGQGQVTHSERTLRVLDVARGQLREGTTTVTHHARLDRSIWPLMQRSVLRRLLGDTVGERLWRGLEEDP